MKKLNIALAALLAVVGVASAVGDGGIWKVGTSTNYAQVNSDGTFETSGGMAAGQVTSTSIADGAIVNADINASAGIVATKLSAAVQTSLGLADTAVQPTEQAGAPRAVGSVATTTNTVTISVQDSDGTLLASRRLVRVWMSEAAYGIPSTNNIESVTLSGGTAIQTVTAAADYIYVTGTNGQASAEIVGTAAGTNYINVADGGYLTSAAVVFE